MKLNAAIIGKNEEKALPRCLASLKGFDQIYFTDTGSIDKTLKIAEDFGARLSYRKWDDDFSAARNYNLDQIPKDEWVFIIDCDEWLPRGEIKKIRQAIAKSKTGACFAHVVNVVDGGKHTHLRFFKNNLRYKDKWHTHIPITKFDLTDVNMMHEPSENHLKDPERNLRIVSKIKEKSPRITFLLAREYMGHKKYRKALALFQKYLDEAPLTQQSCEALTYAAQCLFQLGRVSEAQDAALMALKFNPDYKEALIAMASFSPPWQMKVWARYAQGAMNYGTANIPGRQDERIVQLFTIAEHLTSGGKIADLPDLDKIRI